MSIADRELAQLNAEFLKAEVEPKPKSASEKMKRLRLAPALKIIETFSDVFGIPERDILSNERRTRVYCRVRALCCLALREKLDLSYQEIGDIFGTDHSVALHRAKAGRTLCNKNRRARQLITEICGELS